jgi:hypothetical protein
MNEFINKFLAIIAGLIVGSIGMFVAQYIGHSIYPSPMSMNANDPAQLDMYINEAPVMAILFVAIAWAFGTWLGAFFTSLIARSKRIFLGMIIGTLFFLGGLYNLYKISHPLWFWFVGLSVFFPSAYWGAWVGSRQKKEKQV